MNDRLPYADVSVATVLVAAGAALATYPWVGGTLSIAIAASLAAIPMLAVAATRKPQRIASGQIPWT